MKKIRRAVMVLATLMIGIGAQAITKNQIKNQPVCQRSEGVKLYLEQYFKLSCQQIENKHLQTIKSINLTGWGLSMLFPGDFSGMPNLSEIILSENDISYIEEDVFSGIESLRVLNLSKNKIRFLSPQSFVGLHNLINLDLSENEISEIEGSPFKYLKSLNRLDLFDNCVDLANDVINQGNVCLDKITVNTFKGLTQLLELNLSHSQIIEIEPGSFADTKMLQTLYLSENGISEINAEVFSGLNNLLYLALDDNPLSEIKDDTFANLAYLEVLRIGNYKSKGFLTRLTERTFFGLGRLKVLYLSNNSISTIPARAFKGLTRLVYLNLDTNGIDSLDGEALADLKNLKSLYLQYNKLVKLPDSLFKDYHRNIQVLNLNNNRLNALNPINFMHLKGLLKLEIKSNPVSPKAKEILAPALNLRRLDFRT